LGHLLLESYQLQEALAHYQQVLAQKPDFAPLYFHLGRMQQSLGRTWQRRPDLLKQLQLTKKQQQLLDEYIQQVGGSKT
ncbi:MAG: tetratricopeptide repeat protein, partial [Gammaproteobacteria bacterium]